MVLCWFPGAAATNYHTLGGFKQRQWIRGFRSRKSDVLVSRAGSYLGSGRDSFLAPSSSSDPDVAWLVAASLHSLLLWSQVSISLCLSSVSYEDTHWI